MLFLNILKQSPAKIHSNDLFQRGNELINQMIEANKNDSNDIKESTNALIAPLFELYMDHSEVVFNSLSKAFALDYCPKCTSLKREIANKYLSLLNLHSNIWQESQAGIYELVERGKIVLTNNFGNTKYHNLQSSIKKNWPELMSVLNMVDAYLLSDIYALLPILNEENLIHPNIFDWKVFIELYRTSLCDFSDYAYAAHILSDTRFKEAIAI
jgi:hypothetical protein